MLRHHADLAAQAGQRHGGGVDAVDQDAATSGLHQPHQQVRQRAFARAVGAGQRHRFAGADVQRDAVQRRRPARVGEPHPFEPDVAAHRRQYTALPGGRFRRLGQHGAQTLQRAARLAGLAVDVGQTAHRPRQQGRVQQKTHHLGRRTTGGGAAQLPQDQHQGDGGEKLHAGPERGVDQPLLVAQVQDGADLGAVPRRLQWLARVGLDRRQHGEVFLGDGHRIGVRLLELAGQGAQPPAHDLEQQVEDRDHHQDDRSQARVDAQQHDGCTRNGERQRHDTQQRAADVAGQMRHIVGEQRQHFAVPALLEIGQRQGLQVVVQAHPEIGQDGLGRAPAQPAVAELQHGLQTHDEQQTGQQQAAGLRRAGEQATGKLPCQPGQRERGAGFGQHQHDAQRQRAAPGPCESENEPKVHGGCVCCRAAYFHASGRGRQAG